MHIDTFLRYVNRGLIPPESPDGLDEHGHSMLTRNYKARDSCTARGMWAIVTLAWTERLAEWIEGRNVLEIMAGAGWLAKAFNHYGVDVKATDNGDWDDRHDKMKMVYPVEKFEASKAVEKYNEWADVLVVSWPPYGEQAICDACDAWGSERPIVYIGESDGGCNAPDEFWKRFRESQDAPSVPLMSWSGVHDRVFIGRYSKGVNVAS